MSAGDSDGPKPQRRLLILLAVASCAIVAPSVGCSGGDPVTSVAQVNEAFQKSGVDLVTHRKLGPTTLLVPRDEDGKDEPSLQILVFNSVGAAKKQESMEIGLQRSGTATGEFFIARQENVFVVLPVGSAFDHTIVKEALARL